MIDVGVLISRAQGVDDRHFSYVTALGLFTNISYITDQKTKNILGRAAYILKSIKQLPKILSVNYVINIESEGMEAFYRFS